MAFLKSMVNDVNTVMHATGVKTFITWSQLAAVSAINWDTVVAHPHALVFTLGAYTMKMVFVSSYQTYRQQFETISQSLPMLNSDLKLELERPVRRQNVLHAKVHARLGTGMGPTARHLHARGYQLAAGLPATTATFYVYALPPLAWADASHELGAFVSDVLKPELVSGCLDLPLETVYTLYYLGFPHARFMPAAFTRVFLPLNLCENLNLQGRDDEFMDY